MRSKVLVGLVLAIIIVGCSAPSERETTAGWVGIGETTAVPSNATIIDASELHPPAYLNETFENASKRANTSDSQVVKELSKSEFGWLQQKLSKYEQYNSTEPALTGYYVQYQDTTYRVVLERNEDASV